CSFSPTGLVRPTMELRDAVAHRSLHSMQYPESGLVQGEQTDAVPRVREVASLLCLSVGACHLGSDSADSSGFRVSLSRMSSAHPRDSTESAATPTGPRANLSKSGSEGDRWVNNVVLGRHW